MSCGSHQPPILSAVQPVAANRTIAAATRVGGNKSRRLAQHSIKATLRFGGICMSDKCSLSVIILTYNEEIHIERAMRSVLPIATQVFVVDSFSTDRTLEIARSIGAVTTQHKFVNYSRQFQWALDTLPIETDWIMRLDADEVLTPKLVEELQRRLPGLPQDVSGVALKLGYIFMGRKIKHGGRSLKLIRITRTGAARIEQRWMDEHMMLEYGRPITFKGQMFDSNLRDSTFFTDKHNSYATREAVDVVLNKYRLLKPGSSADPQQIRLKRLLKNNIYYNLPFWCGPLFYFLYRYFLLFGFLDGVEGLIYHFLQGFWYRFLVGAKVWEFNRTLRHLEGREARLTALECLSGIRLLDPNERS
jgi:glycosyltransferase involved in cell wall biosynthesis